MPVEKCRRFVGFAAQSGGYAAAVFDGFRRNAAFFDVQMTPVLTPDLRYATGRNGLGGSFDLTARGSGLRNVVREIRKDAARQIRGWR